MSLCGSSLFKGRGNYIKVGNGQFVAIEGANMAERLILSDLRIPYEQILKSKISLKAGQKNYLLNHLGLGDNVTFMLVKVTYDGKSLEEDNFISYKTYDNIEEERYISEMMVLTGNSVKRIPQLFLSNPNEDYGVKIDLMLAIIDDKDSFFDYKPTVYFNKNVDLLDTDCDGPYNTSMGYNFESNVEIGYGYGYDYNYEGGIITKSDIISIFIENVKDSNGVLMHPTVDNYKLYYNDEEVPDIGLKGDYYLYFDIEDDLGNRIDPVDNLKIVVS